jgi:hypothetical protein
MPHRFCACATDDLIIIDYIDLHDVAYALEQTDAYGFYTRLGTDIDYCYPLQCAQTIPPLTPITPNTDILAWQFGTGQTDWNYPHTVDMTIYRTDFLISQLTQFTFTNPNTLESIWSQKSVGTEKSVGLCFTKARCINIPLNRVQNSFNNIHMNAYQADELLTLWNKGYHIDIEPLYQLRHNAAHVAMYPAFIQKRA